MNALLTPPAGQPILSARDRLTLSWAAAAYALAYLAWSAFSDAPPRVQAFAQVAAFLPLTLAAALLFLRARRRAANASLRLALGLLAAAAASVILGNLVTLAQMAIGHRLAGGALADAFYVAAYPLNFTALLLIPAGERSIERWKMLCDAGMVLSGAGVALWYFVLRGVVASTADPALVTLALVYPLADLLLLVGFATIILRQPAGVNRGGIRWLGIAIFLIIVADLAFNQVVTRSGGRSAVWLDALFLAYSVSLVVCAEHFWRGTGAEPPPSAARVLVATRLRTLLPFAAGGATYLLLLVVALREWVAPLSGLAIGAIAVSVFLGARQLLAFRRDASILAEAAVRASEARFRSLVQNSSDLIFELATDGAITFASSSASRVIGYEPEALAGVQLSAIVHPDDAARVSAFVRMAMHLTGVSPAAEWRFVRPDGDTVQVEVMATNLLDDPTVHGVVLNARDVGERTALLDQLAHQAFHDPLTGLANRSLFYDRVAHAITLAERQGRTVMVLFLDLDDFKQVNDTLGHAEGDRLLTMIAARLRACARATDTVARLGGDEFALLVEDQTSDDGGDRLIGRIREQMDYPFLLAGTDVHVSTSIGSATAHSGSVDDLLRHADIAMYAAKRAEKGTHRAYEVGMTT